MALSSSRRIGSLRSCCAEAVAWRRNFARGAEAVAWWRHCPPGAKERKESRRTEYCGWQKSCTTREHCKGGTPLPPDLILCTHEGQLLQGAQSQNPAPGVVVATPLAFRAREQQY